MVNAVDVVARLVAAATRTRRKVVILFNMVMVGVEILEKWKYERRYTPYSCVLSSVVMSISRQINTRHLAMEADGSR